MASAITATEVYARGCEHVKDAAEQPSFPLALVYMSKNGNQD